MTETRSEATAEEARHLISTGRCLHCGKPAGTVERSGVILDSPQNARRRVKLDTHGHAMTCTGPTGAR